MKTSMLLLILATLTMTSPSARADDYAKERRQIFVLEKGEWLRHSNNDFMSSPRRR